MAPCFDAEGEVTSVREIGVSKSVFECELEKSVRLESLGERDEVSEEQSNNVYTFAPVPNDWM